MSQEVRQRALIGVDTGPWGARSAVGALAQWQRSGDGGHPRDDQPSSGAATAALSAPWPPGQSGRVPSSTSSSTWQYGLPVARVIPSSHVRWHGACSVTIMAATSAACGRCT